MKARQIDNRIELEFRYDPRIVAFVKALPGRTYNAGRKTWSVPLSEGTQVLEKLVRLGFEVERSLMEAVEKDRREAEEVAALAVMDDTEFESPLPLFPYQKVGAAFLYKIGSGILGDEMGLGKTIQTLALCKKVKPDKVLVFCPAVLKYQWESEIKKFLGDEVKVSVVHGDKKKRDEAWKADATFFVANYELLLRDLPEMIALRPDIILADEATRLANPHAKSSKAIKKIPAKRRIAMTGTLISNRAQDVWNIVDFVAPGAMGNFFYFLDQYCVKNHFGSIFAYKNMDELKKKLQRYMIRRTKTEVLPDLPPKICSDVPVEMSEAEKALYKRIKKEILFEIEKTDIAKMENPMTIQYTLVKMTRLRQLTSSLELLGDNTASAKLAALQEILQEAMDGDRKAIVFTQFAQMADILERELAPWGVCKISGTVDEEYQDIVARFNTDESKRVLVMTSAGQFGLNIQRASILVHYDQEWSLAKMQQREGRAHRIGQTKDVLVYNLLCRGTIDMYVRKVLHGKAELSSALIDRMPDMSDIKEMLMYE